MTSCAEIGNVEKFLMVYAWLFCEELVLAQY